MMLLFSFHRGTRRNILHISLLILLLAGAGLVAVRLRTPTPAHASGGGGGGPCLFFCDFTQLTNPANSPRGVSWTRLNNSLINGDPQAVLVVTPSLMPNGVFNNHPIGVYYNGPYWYIYNEDGAPMPMEAAFNVYTDDPGGFVQTATSANTISGDTYIDQPGLDGQPATMLQVTSNITPGGGGGVFDPHPVGVGYDPFRERWHIFNLDGTPIPAGASFNVEWAHKQIDGGTLQATPTNSFGDYVEINDPNLNGKPEAMVWVTAAPVSNNLMENHTLGVIYNGNSGHWYIINLDRAPMSNGATFFYWFT